MHLGHNAANSLRKSGLSIQTLTHFSNSQIQKWTFITPFKLALTRQQLKAKMLDRATEFETDIYKKAKSAVLKSIVGGVLQNRTLLSTGPSRQHSVVTNGATISVYNHNIHKGQRTHLSWPLNFETVVCRTREKLVKFEWAFPRVCLTSSFSCITTPSWSKSKALVVFCG